MRTGEAGRAPASGSSLLQHKHTPCWVPGWCRAPPPQSPGPRQAPGQAKQLYPALRSPRAVPRAASEPGLGRAPVSSLPSRKAGREAAATRPASPHGLHSTRGKPASQLRDPGPDPTPSALTSLVQPALLHDGHVVHGVQLRHAGTAPAPLTGPSRQALLEPSRRTQRLQEPKGRV